MATATAALDSSSLTAIDKMKQKMLSLMSVHPSDQPAPSRSREQLEHDLDVHRATNSWTIVALEAEELLTTLSQQQQQHQQPQHQQQQQLNHHTPAPSNTSPLATPASSTVSSSSPLYSHNESFALALTCLAQCSIVQHQPAAATLLVDKALASDDSFMDALYVKALLELSKPVTATSQPSSNDHSPLHTSKGGTQSPASAPSKPSSAPPPPPFSPVLTGPDRVSAHLALSWLNRYRWQDHKQWSTLEGRRRSAYRYRLLLELILSRGKLNEMLGQWGEAASQYSQVLTLASTELRVDEDIEAKVLYAQVKAPRMLLYSGQRGECLRLMRSVLISTPSNYSPTLISSLRHSFASLILRAFSSTDYLPISTNDQRTKPSSYTQEAFFLLTQSGIHSLVSVPTTPPSLHWHPFSPISLSHGYSSHAVYLSHSPVPLPLTSTATPRPNMSTIISLDFSTTKDGLSPPQEEKDRVERETVLTLARQGEFVVLAEMYRNLLAGQLESPQLWYKLSITLMAAGQFNEAYLAITECITRAPDYVMALLMAGKLCLNVLDKTKEAVAYASHALEVAQSSTPVMPARGGNPLQALRAAAAPVKGWDNGTSSPSSPRSAAAAAGGRQTAPPLSAPPALTFTTTSANQLTLTPSLHASLLLSCQLLFGVACSKYAYSVSTFANRKSLQRRALAVLQVAFKHSPSNHAVLFALACLYADIREIGMSLSILKQCLSIDRSHVHSWNLLALLLSSQKKYVDAVKACEGRKGKGCEVLLLTKGRLLGEMSQFDDACRCMIELASLAFSKDEFELREGKAGAKGSRRPVFKTKKGAASTAPSSQVLNIDDPALFKADVLLLLAQLYAAHYSRNPTDGELLGDAYECVYKCRTLAPASLLPSIHSHLAALALLSASPGSALHHFESALALDSTHTPSLIGLASLFSSPHPPLTPNPVLSYGYLTQALQIDATDHRAWHEMGMVLITQGKGEEAVDQLMTAAELERTAPISSFGTVQRRV